MPMSVRLLNSLLSIGEREDVSLPSLASNPRFCLCLWLTLSKIIDVLGASPVILYLIKMIDYRDCLDAGLMEPVGAEVFPAVVGGIGGGERQCGGTLVVED